jgi:tRNA-specific 2-thiouridylase
MIPLRLLNDGPGNIVRRDGKVLGQHPGNHWFTVGQRKRLKLPSPSPYFVTELRSETNEVVVGEPEELLAERMSVRRVNWQREPRLGMVQVKIRSRHGKTDAEIMEISDSQVSVRFQTPQKAVTPGQAAVFYEQNRVLGGGWIHQAYAKIYSEVGAA